MEGPPRHHQPELLPTDMAEVLQDPTVFWEAATLVDAYNEVKDPNDTLVASGADFNDYYLLSSAHRDMTAANVVIGW